MKKPKRVIIDIDSAGILKSAMAGLSDAVSRRMTGYVEAAMKAEAEKVKADAMMRVPIRTNVRKGGLFGTKADYMIIDDPALDSTKNDAVVGKILNARNEYLKSGMPLEGAELWLTVDQLVDVATYTRNPVHDGDQFFGLTVRIDYHGGSVIAPPYIIAPAPKAEPMTGVGHAFAPKVTGWDFGSGPDYSYVTHEQAEAYAGEVLAGMAGKPSRKRQDAFTKPEGRKAGSAPEVPVVASAGRFVEVPED